MKQKFNAYQKTIYDFINDIYVECPVCKKKAIVKTNGFFKDKSENMIKIVCPNCGFNKFLNEKAKNKTISDKIGPNYDTENYLIGDNKDPYFRLPLWLQKEFSNGIFWAYNYEHLDYLEKHISAELRERDLTEISNKSIGSRLPNRMTSKKNRTELLKGIKTLRNK